MRTGLLVVGHGSRNPSANTEFECLVDAYRSARPEMDVAHGYVELAEPSLSAALGELARRCEQVVLLPLFLFAAGHVKNDLPLALAQARRDFPGTRFLAANPLGAHPGLVSLVRDRARASLGALGGAGGSTKTAAVVVGRGSSDPDANGEFCKVVRLFAEGMELSWVMPCFIGIVRPLLSEALDLLARSRPDRIVVVPYFLFAGRLIGRLEEQVAEFGRRYGWIRTHVASHLGVEPRIFGAIDDRLNEAMEGGLPLPCDTCHYRVPITEVVENVGGLRALLWSLRHRFTHTQAMPHEHAHPALKKHVLVCGNVDCADRGSIGLITALRRLVKESGKARDIRVTRTHCMGRCGEGPTVAVYPDGIWYRGVKESDARELVQQHLLGDGLVGRLVDNIMQ